MQLISCHILQEGTELRLTEVSEVRSSLLLIASGSLNVRLGMQIVESFGQCVKRGMFDSPKTL